MHINTYSHHFLKQIKADYYLPNRYIDGYGLTNEVIDKICDKYNPNLIITVDCGISCYQEVEYAKTKGKNISYLESIK